ncbi:DUF2065 domain-containing protein [Ferrimonas balearica]|nr:DUF2065 domain-containing protein [Ferrimonas balearica]MBY6018689.1 DUF2065 domain-containing protein [Halomonas denitrificans]MBW3140525.1 DUF2065 domain-containing protein [Ferrimonas balearica]MBW3165481.1 DUF2065 domain-containing protein [Ferrimonas balearica]MBY5981305.1 DUF2065 domain-containing protein [Ferrimonas balearica]MBY6095889.1 DUF2065 domain-containing protein [Ferrimonas balearica]
MWLIGGVMLIEGLGPLLFPRQWQAMMRELAGQDTAVLRRIGGALVTAGAVLLYIFSA